MKKHFIYTALIALATIGCARKTVALVVRETKPVFMMVTIHNPDNFERKNQPVVLSYADLVQANKNAQLLGVYLNAQEISSQSDDLNGDGVLDELTFLIDLAPNETKIVGIAPRTDDDSFPKEVFAEMFLKDKDTKEITPVTEASSSTGDLYYSLHHHGPAFESDLIAYRVYFDRKITVDVYGKVKRQLELNDTKWYPTPEQLAAGYGDDILWVQGAVGVGTVKGWDGKKATHIEPVTNRTERIVSQGNLRTIVDIVNNGWVYNGDTLDMTVRYILYARHRDVEAQVFIENTEGGETVVCTGVQKFPESVTYDDRNGCRGVWATEWTAKDTLVSTRQTFGLGVVVPRPAMINEVEDTQNALVLMSNQGHPSFKFYLTAASAKEEKGFQTAEAFFAYLDQWKKQMLSPVVVKIKR